MKKTIFAQAREIVQKNKIEFKGSGNDREFYEVATVPIQLIHNKLGFTFRCTCKFHSIKESGDGAMCSYISSLITYLVQK